MTTNVPIMLAYARAMRRDYITPEDIGSALLDGDRAAIALEVLTIIGGISRPTLGIEDASLCAFTVVDASPLSGAEGAAEDQR